MDPLDLTQSFIERCERSVPQSELAENFEHALAHMGFRYFACCSHVNSRNPPRRAVLLYNCPDAWARSYVDRKLHERDPIFQHAERTILPFSWDAPDFRSAVTSTQQEILKEAANIGLARGYTVPIHLLWSAGALRASCSVVPDSGSIAAGAYRAVQVMSMYLYASVGYQDDLVVARNCALHAGPMP